GEQARRAATMRSRHPSWIPDDEEEERLDRLLAIGCATHALNRHCGTMLLTRGEAGPPTLARDGPDLREVKWVVGTGGVFAHRDDGAEILEAALARRAPRSLAPRNAHLAVDRGYLLGAAGLLASLDPEAALKLLERELKKTRHTDQPVLGSRQGH
ncbi:MAG: glutamate mutase L, partial [Solirubrobacterales bacterium]